MIKQRGWFRVKVKLADEECKYSDEDTQSCPPFPTNSTQRSWGLNASSTQGIPVFVTMTSLLLEPEPLFQATISVCFLLQLPLSGLFLLQFIIYVAAEWPFKTINPDNKLHEGKDPDSDKFITVCSSWTRSQCPAHSTHSKSLMRTIEWENKKRKKNLLLSFPSVAPHTFELY